MSVSWGWWWVVVVVKGFRVRDGKCLVVSRKVSLETVVILVQNANSTFLKNRAVSLIISLLGTSEILILASYFLSANLSGKGNHPAYPKWSGSLSS